MFIYMHCGDYNIYKTHRDCCFLKVYEYKMSMCDSCVLILSCSTILCLKNKLHLLPVKYAVWTGLQHWKHNMQKQLNTTSSKTLQFSICNPTHDFAEPSCTMLIHTVCHITEKQGVARDSEI